MSTTKKKSKWDVEYGGETEHYKWTQTEQEVVITIIVPQGTRSKDVTCTIGPKHLKFGFKGKPLIIDGELYQPVATDESAWTIDGTNLEITLTKGTTSEKWWKCAIVGDPQIDVQKIEGSKYIHESLLEKLKAQEEEEEKLQTEPTQDAQNNVQNS
mmetsp:Transcript_12545/g.17379  ORF Transcript_12545/g.17379 Transcript_12545/m.17379 type:complete len:156 (-) Transcript_12545:1474-1941(-)